MGLLDNYKAKQELNSDLRERIPIDNKDVSNENVNSIKKEIRYLKEDTLKDTKKALKKFV